jgi:hypothetical protein
MQLQRIDSKSAAALIKEHLAIKEHLTTEAKRFDELMQPLKDRLAEVNASLLQLLNALGSADRRQLSTDNGTAYVSNILTLAVDPDSTFTDDTGKQSQGRDALLDFCLQHWDEIGSEMLMIAAQKDAVKDWMEGHEGQPPPGLKIGWRTQLNVRRS